MGARGPAPKPAALKLLEGNPGKRPTEDRGPKPKPVAPKCPAWLDREAKREWRRVAPELERLGLLTVVDGTALSAYCTAYSRWVAAEQVLAAEGSTYESERLGKVLVRPEVAIARQMMAMVKTFCAEFGLSPASRGRMSLPEMADDDDDNPFDV